ncbi:MAG: FtsX-like permease family protein [Gemmatimonadetes bacterium]|nr:ABC transporter permease [Gemmatimonadota bacterium]NNM05044.1 FtsX-like permease family protein [Gemmatimonadota bacterium]
MRLGRNLLLSAKALLRHRIRTALALSGTAVGVGAVMVITSIGEGAEAEVISEIEALGQNLLVISAGDAPRVPWRGRTEPKVTTLTLDDAAALSAGAPEIARLAPAQDRGRRVKFGQISTMTKILGTTPEFEEVRDFRTTQGRYFTREEDLQSARVAILGSRVRELLFPNDDPLGKTIRIGRVPFQVIGVLESKGATVDGLSEEDNQVVIPLQTGLRRVFNLDYLKMIYVQAQDGSRLEEAEAQITEVLRVRHRMSELEQPNDFAIQNQRVILRARLETVSSFNRMSLGLGIVALLVGGIGILSVMLLSVRERRNEVGLRVAVGARRRDILVQFLVESLFLGIMGGLAGVVIGLAVAWGVGRSTEWSTVINGTAILVGLTAALGVGAIFGVFPAQRAAGMDPIDALRAE